MKDKVKCPSCGESLAVRFVDAGDESQEITLRIKSDRSALISADHIAKMIRATCDTFRETARCMGKSIKTYVKGIECDTGEATIRLIVVEQDKNGGNA